MFVSLTAMADFSTPGTQWFSEENLGAMDMTKMMDKMNLLKSKADWGNMGTLLMIWYKHIHQVYIIAFTIHLYIIIWIQSLLEIVWTIAGLMEVVAANWCHSSSKCQAMLRLLHYLPDKSSLQDVLADAWESCKGSGAGPRHPPDPPIRNASKKAGNRSAAGGEKDSWSEDQFLHANDKSLWLISGKKIAQWHPFMVFWIISSTDCSGMIGFCRFGAAKISDHQNISGWFVRSWRCGGKGAGTGIYQLQPSLLDME